MKQIKFYTLLLITLLAVSCNQEDEQTDIPTPAARHNNVTLLLEVPGYSVPSTYTMSEIDENRVNDLTIVAFEIIAGVEKITQIIRIDADSTDPIIINDGNGNMKVKFALPAGSYNRIVLLANANDILMPSGRLQLGVSFDDFANIDFMMGNWDVDTPAYIPMSAEKVADVTNGITVQDGVSQTISGLKLTRALARVDIINNASATFELKDVQIWYKAYFVRIYANGNHLKSPAETNLPISGEGSEFSKVYDFPTLAINNKMERQIYIGERRPAGNAYSIRILIKGKFKGVDYYYPVDFTYDGTNGGNTGDFMPVVRNHKYIFTIAEVSAPGYADSQDAYDSTDRNTNIAVKLFVINGEFTDIKYNSQNMLAVDKTEYFFKSREFLTDDNRENKMELLSAGSWAVTATAEDGVTPVTWLTASPNSGAGGTQERISVNINSRPPVPTLQRTGYLIVKAGRLETKIKVTQDADFCGKDGVALKQKLVNFEYLTHRYGNDCWMVENSKEGAPIATAYTGHTAGELGYYYNWERARRAPTDNAAPCPAGWHLPSDIEWYQLENIIGNDKESIGKWWHTASLMGGKRGEAASGTVWNEWNIQGSWWSTTSPIPARGNYVQYDSRVAGSGFKGVAVNSNTNLLLSVRCVQDW